MIFLFSFFIYYKLTEDNFNITLEEHKDYKFVIKLWHSYCQFSKQFQPIWEEIVKNENIIDNLIYADIECMQNSKICNKLASPTYPRVFYIEPKYNLIYEMKKPLTLNRTLNFIRDMEYYPCLFNSNEQREDEILFNKQNNSSLFEPFFQYEIPQNNQKTLEQKISIMRKSFINANVNSTQIYCKLTNNSSPKLIIYNDKQQFVYNGTFEENELIPFLERINMKQILDFNNKSWNILKNSQSQFFIFVSKNKIQYTSTKSIIENISKKVKNYRFLLDDPNLFYASTIFPISKSVNLPYILYVDTKSNKYCLFDREFNQKNIENWIDSIILEQNSKKCSSFSISSNNLTDQTKRLWIMWAISLSLPIIICSFIIYLRIPKHKRKGKSILPL